MAKIVQLHRMSTAQAQLYTGPIGELIVDTSSNRILVQDGVTPGGNGVCMANLNLADLADAAVARANLGAAPITSPDFLISAAVAGDAIATLLASQTLVNKTLTAPVITSGVFTAPILGIPASGNLTNCTGYDTADLVGQMAVTNISGLGANVLAFLQAALNAAVATMLGQVPSGTGGLLGKISPTITTTQTVNARTGTASEKLFFTGLTDNVAGTSSIEIRSKLTDSVTGPTPILTTVGRSGLVQVQGTSGGNRFSDIVHVTPNSFAVISSLTDSGAPAARTYSMIGFSLNLTIAVGYNIHAVVTNIDERN